MQPDQPQTVDKTGAKVLIVEDDPMIQEMYEVMFNLKNFQVELANNGVEGLEKAASFNPEIILMDIMMPKMNGLQALENLKKDEKLKSIPVIMLTNLADESDIQKALSLGAVKYLVKSDYIPAQIAEIVEQVLVGLHSGQTPAT